MPQITLEVLDERLNNFFRENKEDHITLIKQTTETNGRVSKLEIFKSKIIGALIVMNIFAVPIILYLLFKRLEGK